MDEIIKRLGSFKFEGVEQPVSFIESMLVTTGVACDVYSFISDDTKDLGIIRIKAGCKTPLQKVLKGERTIEGYISGNGKLTITKTDGSKVEYPATGKELIVTVRIGELMQWQAAADSELVAYEICFPPYTDGRYENLL
jgi:hypothetical protein